MFKLIDAESGPVDLSCRKAADFLKLNVYPAQRAILSRRLDDLKHAISSGMFRPPAQIAFARLNGDKMMVNGQTTCTAVRELETTVPGNVEVYACESMKDVADLYSTFDPGNSARNQGAINAPYAHAEGLAELGANCINHCAKVLPFVANGVNHKSGLSMTEKAQLLAPYQDECRFIHSVLFCGERKPRHLLFRPVIGASIIATSKISKPAAREFWGEVRDGAGLEDNSPTKTLREWLLAALGRTQAQFKRNIEHWRLWDGCGHAWNAWCEGRSLKMIQLYPGSDLVKLKTPKYR